MKRFLVLALVLTGLSFTGTSRAENSTTPAPSVPAAPTPAAAPDTAPILGTSRSTAAPAEAQAAPVSSMPKVITEQAEKAPERVPEFGGAAKDSTEILQPYVPPTYDSLARAFWSLNVYSTDEEPMIDNFLMITECDLYRKFYTNEFEWKKIREATRIYLDKYKSSFTRRFEYTQPIFLDRYDFKLKGFSLMEKNVFQTSTKIEVASNLATTVKCSDIDYNNVPGYPSAMMLSVRTPFKLSFIRVNEDLAQEFLKIGDEKNLDLSGGRPAYIRFRIRADRYYGLTYVSQRPYANFGGVIETIEVFGDPDLMFKLYEQALY